MSATTPTGSGIEYRVTDQVFVIGCGRGVHLY
jgi:hypothetical protein